ncbi:MAG TPA: cytochrome c oxidase subunit 3 [Nevskiaceae bacterium]|nr:cytochrome c oxidase subunit 3 [Nevskiaceae bacterium]
MSVVSIESPKSVRVPGELGIWAFICVDLFAFTMYFGTFLWERAQAPEVFAAGSASLSLAHGVVNTLMLLTSSLFVALAVQAMRAGDRRRGQRYVLAAAAGGLVFILNKPFEWLAKLDAGLGPHHDHFFQLYYLLTGLHLAHVIVGMVVLRWLWKLAGLVRRAPTARQARFIESGAIYWHLVDLIWLVLFALFYLLK